MKITLPHFVYKVLCKPGTLVLMHYGLMHRGTRRLPGSNWRPMIKLKFTRTTAPAPLTIPASLKMQPFAYTSATPAEQELWTSVLNWMLGGDNNAVPSSGFITKADGDLFPTLLASAQTDVERLGLAYAVGRTGCAAAATSLAAVMMQPYGAPGNPQQAAMHGLAIGAGEAAVPLLLQLCAEQVVVEPPPNGDGWVAATRAAWALGEASRQPASLEHAVEVLAKLLSSWLALLVGKGDFSAPPTELCGLQHRACAVCVQALQAVVERAAAARLGGVVRKVVELLLPLTLGPDIMKDAPVEALYTGLTGGRYWLSEGASLAILSACSGGGGGHKGSVCAPSGDSGPWSARPASICLLALTRARHGSPAHPAIDLLEAAEAQWLLARENPHDGPEATQWAEYL
jgi:hypothetical protein